MWIASMLSFSPPFIKPISDKIAKQILESEFNGLKLSKDASEFRKTYKRIQDKKTSINLFLSQISQTGKLGN